MRRSLLPLTAASLFVLGSASTTFAQSHEIPALNSCIKEFYDPGMYNYLSFKNNCTQALTIVFVAKDGSGASGSMDLRPGASDSVGRLANGTVPKVGGFELYVCPVGSMPVDENKKVVTKPQTTFRCEAKVE